ncbi:hypothetical protein CDD82_193 [Ophiocordyceps australis]|uniref:histidine kinase n=1 Tax=Ophiocordyceps australis TaxID=1399860 RepID=A0A2C5YPF9_9HYPO|nr:hypothetical protein CDD82_193 [Ophiocordyceps australis]
MGDARGGRMAQHGSSFPDLSHLDSPVPVLTEHHGADKTALRHGESTNPGAADLKLASQPPASPSRLSTSQEQLNEYREKLARDLEVRELWARSQISSHTNKMRVSPIQEEVAPTSPLIAAPLPSASTESGHTVRGVMTPSFVAGTPSYPFPRMAGPGFAPLHLHKPLPCHSSPSWPSRPSLDVRGSLDKVLSENSTPASNCNFNPSAASQLENFDSSCPNLYELSLMLNAEPGLDAWWNTVVQIMRDVYKAERVTLAVPADTTDVENVPWGQKATYNEHERDELSMAYMAKGSSAVFSSDLDASDASVALREAVETTTPARPNLASRHSFTSYEKDKQNNEETASSPVKRPCNLTRSKSNFLPAKHSEDSPADYTKLNKNALDEHDASEAKQDIPSWEVPFMARFEGQGRVLPVLQALDYEADPLIDHTGVMRVLQRGRPVALTRSYPYLPTRADVPSEASAEVKGKNCLSTDCSKKGKRQRAESVSKLSSIFSGRPRSKTHGGEKIKSVSYSLQDEDSRPPTPKYEEYEQAPPSPWSQSPAPSPAVRSDPKENPFFTDAMVDEESFNPGSSPTSYSGMRPPEAIGVDNCWTVLHIPLTHVLLSRPTRPFRLDASSMEQRSSQSRNKDEGGPDRKETCETDRPSPEGSSKSSLAPIAILSVLSPMIPYPTTLRTSLEHLAPHMATSFSLCRHYTNLEIELAGIQRRRPQATGFGAVAPYAPTVTNGSYLAVGDAAQVQSMGGSMTSPSDYSAVSKSATGSPIGTPGWEQGSLNFLMDRRQPTNSPIATPPQGNEGYFGSKQRPSSMRQETLGSGSQKSRTGSKDMTGEGKRLAALSSAFRSSQDSPSPDMPGDKAGMEAEDSGLQSRREVLARKKDKSLDSLGDGTAVKTNDNKGVESHKGDSNRCRHGHSVLHSYGADFASTFQSLPPSSSVVNRAPTTASATARNSSMTSPVMDMAPPSDRLKGLILDSLPAHVFVALPQTGETVWVNSRFLSYRGQTVADLAADPWGSIHSDDRDGYLKAWGHSLRTGEQFSRTVRIRRFDGAYRWFYARAVASKDKRGVIMQFLGSYMDIHDQHIAELRAARQEEVEASEAKHRLLANLIPQIIFTATEDEGITFANEQWLSYTGQSFEGSLNLGFMDYVHPEDLAKCRIPQEVKGKALVGPGEGQGETESQSSRSGLSRSSSSGSESVQETTAPSADLRELAKKGIIKVATDSSGRVSYTTEVRLRSRTGEYRWHLIRCVEIDTIDFGRGASSYFGSATDINDHKLLETKLKEAMESKSRFLSNMSHEIRTPLIGISGMVTFLQDTTLDEEQRDYTNTIQTSANSLIMIINDILDLSKVDAGMMKLKYEWFHTRSLIEDVNELVSTMAIAKRLELNYLVDAEVPAWVKGDKVRIRQVLLNVIGNAIKFTSEGEVFSRCRVYTHDEHGIVLQFAITDTGRGFSKDEAELIFKPFSQIDGSSTRQHGGSGLGLVISRQLVELHGGRMEGKAELGKGSTFTFTARFALPTPDDHPNLPGTLEPPDGPPRALKPLPALQQVRDSPGAASTASSEPSVHSARSHMTDRSSATTCRK